jgi:hypothetical protein
VKKKLLFFGLKLSISLIIAFLLQSIVFNKLGVTYSFDLLLSSYIVNFFLAFLIVGAILLYINKLKSYIGFLFMLGSFIKFGVFFIFFYPIFKEDGIISSFEFSLFFIPYMICLLYETFSLTSILNKM